MNRIELVFFVVVLTLLLLAPAAGSAPAAPQPIAPSVVSYQGHVMVDGKPHSGPGYFKFAIVNADGSYSFWSNDGQSSKGSEPKVAVALSVTNGLFSVACCWATPRWGA